MLLIYGASGTLSMVLNGSLLMVLSASLLMVVHAALSMVQTLPYLLC